MAGDLLERSAANRGIGTEQSEQTDPLCTHFQRQRRLKARISVVMVEPVGHSLIEGEVMQMAVEVPDAAGGDIFFVVFAFDMDAADPHQAAEPGRITAAALQPFAEKKILAAPPEHHNVGFGRTYRGP